MRHRHSAISDHICPRCKMMIRAYIVHECDPSICLRCDGTGMEWVGRVEGAFVGQRACQKCGGTGRTIFGDEMPV